MINATAYSHSDPKFNLPFIIRNKVFGGLFKQWDETFGSLSFRGTDTDFP